MECDAATMFSEAPAKNRELGSGERADAGSGELLGRKIWLPKLLYNFLPYFYIIAGIAALLATLYISEWFWVLPHYLLFSAACLHMGIYVYLRRHRR